MDKVKVKMESELVDYLTTSSQIRCINFNCIHNLISYPNGYASCNIKHIEINDKGMCETKQEKNMGVSTSG